MKNTAAVALARLTDAELSHRMTEVRQCREAIRPYYSRNLEADARGLSNEFNRRTTPQVRTPLLPDPAP